MFSTVDALVISKIDCLPYFDFDISAVYERAKKLNPSIEIFEVSAKTGEGVDAWSKWLKESVEDWIK